MLNQVNNNRVEIPCSSNIVIIPSILQKILEPYNQQNFLIDVNDSFQKQKPLMEQQNRKMVHDGQLIEEFTRHSSQHSSKQQQQQFETPIDQKNDNRRLQENQYHKPIEKFRYPDHDHTQQSKQQYKQKEQNEPIQHARRNTDMPLGQRLQFDEQNVHQEQTQQSQLQQKLNDQNQQQNFRRNTADIPKTQIHSFNDQQKRNPVNDQAQQLHQLPSQNVRGNPDVPQGQSASFQKERKQSGYVNQDRESFSLNNINDSAFQSKQQQESNPSTNKQSEQSIQRIHQEESVELPRFSAVDNDHYQYKQRQRAYTMMPSLFEKQKSNQEEPLKINFESQSIESIEQSKKLQKPKKNSKDQIVLELVKQLEDLNMQLKHRDQTVKQLKHDVQELIQENENLQKQLQKSNHSSSERIEPEKRNEHVNYYQDQQIILQLENENQDLKQIIDSQAVQIEQLGEEVLQKDTALQEQNHTNQTLRNQLEELLRQLRELQHTEAELDGLIQQATIDNQELSTQNQQILQETHIQKSQIRDLTQEMQRAKQLNKMQSQIVEQFNDDFIKQNQLIKEVAIYILNINKQLALGEIE